MSEIIQLSACPFCGEQPIFSEAYDVDDRRYMKMDLNCCVNMSASIPWPDYSEISHQEIDTRLKSSLTQQWNHREASQPLPLQEGVQTSPTIRDAMRWSGCNPDYYGLITFLPDQLEKFVSFFAAAAVSPQGGEATSREKWLECLVDAYMPKSMQYDIEHPNDGLNAAAPASLGEAK